MRDYIAVALIAYLCGSIPFGYILVRLFRGQDVRATGSGNIGATNVARTAPGLGIATLILDAAKGLIAVLLSVFLFARIPATGQQAEYLAAYQHAVSVETLAILFAVVGSSTPVLALESLIAGAFLALAVAGFKKNLWLIVAALAGHGVFDFFHHLFIQNPGVPVWWPGFCLSFDVLAGGFLAMLLMRRSGFASKI